MGASSSVRVTICMGSSCFSRGNNKLLAALQGFVARNELADRVELVGSRCMEQCMHGPNVVVDGQTHAGLSPEAMVELVAVRLGMDAPDGGGR